MYLPKQKRNKKSSSNPFNANISFEAFLHIPVSKVEEGNYESYNLQGFYLCTLSFCCCWDRAWGALTHFYFLTTLKMRFFCFMITFVSLSLWSFQWSNGHPSKFMFEMHFSISDNILTISLGSSFFFSGAYITHWLKRFTFHFYSYLRLPLNRPLDTKWIGRA
jgi:hypothetical protein